MGGVSGPTAGADLLSGGGRWIAGALAALALLAWGAMIHWGMRMGTMGANAHPMGAASFLLMWGVMQAAMMFPSVVVMALGFASISRRQPGSHPLRTAAFLSGYLTTWILTGFLAYPAWLGIQTLLARHPDTLRGIGAAILIASGLYQVSPLKYRCLAHCRSPWGFFMEHPVGRSPAAGLRLGLRHGAFCVACCWALMAVLFAVGIMNLAWMGLLTLAIFAEKTLRHGHRIGQAIGVGLIGLGLALLAAPPAFGRFLVGA